MGYAQTVYFVKILVTAQTQLRSYSEQQRAFGNSNICNCPLARTGGCLEAGKFIFLQPESCNMVNNFRRKFRAGDGQKDSSLGLTDQNIAFWEKFLIKFC